MSDIELEKNIIANFEKAFPRMSNIQKEKLLYYGEGMLAVLENKEESQEESES